MGCGSEKPTFWDGFGEMLQSKIEEAKEMERKSITLHQLALVTSGNKITIRDEEGVPETLTPYLLAKNGERIIRKLIVAGDVLAVVLTD